VKDLESSPNNYQITKKGGHESVGIIAFTEGKLSYVVKDWINTDDCTADQLIDTLHAVIQKMEERGEQLTAISTDTRKEPDMIMKEIKFLFGKTLSVTIDIVKFKHQRKEHTIIGVQEILR
jgi:hypothetical protein